ncbi:PEP-CTERM sorting domain-containing protein [Rhodopila sp.]|uniref:PEP-CTERM sorting domain-containing protein n=1 Tax=Rhodopila sp. TaxID=2480087 RepID=UPI003D12E34A
MFSFKRGLFMLAAVASMPLCTAIAHATPSVEMIGYFTGTTTSITDPSNAWGLKTSCSGKFGCDVADQVTGSFYYDVSSTGAIGNSQLTLTLDGITHTVSGQGLALLFQDFAGNGEFQLLPNKTSTTSLTYAAPGWLHSNTTLTTNEIFSRPSASEAASEFDFNGSSVDFYVDSLDVPEPMSVALLSVGLLGVAAARRLRRTI